MGSLSDTDAVSQAPGFSSMSPFIVVNKLEQSFLSIFYTGTEMTSVDQMLDFMIRTKLISQHNLRLIGTHLSTATKMYIMKCEVK